MSEVHVRRAVGDWHELAVPRLEGQSKVVACEGVSPPPAHGDVCRCVVGRRCGVDGHAIVEVVEVCGGGYHEQAGRCESRFEGTNDLVHAVGPVRWDEMRDIGRY